MTEVINGLKYTFYIYAHPFDGFWVMKKEKKGGWKTGFAILALLVITTAIRILNSGYLFTSAALADFSVWLLSLAVVVAVLLYCVANWALTTLMDGMGAFVEIFTSLMYSLTPLVIANIPITLLTQIFVIKEAAFYSFINFIFILWTVFLIAAANMTIHEYSMQKSIATIILTVFGMAVIAVLFVLVCNLTQQVWLWVAAVINEATFRI